MIVRCPNCGTTYRLDDAKLSPQGTWVRCARGCGEVFQVFPESQPSQPAAPAPQSEPAPAPTPQPAQPQARPRGKGVKILFWILATVVLLAGLGVGSVVVMQRLGVAPQLVQEAARVPGMGWLLGRTSTQPTPARARAKLSLVGVRGFFRLNDMLGRVFVIQGRVQNEGPGPCYKVLIRGRLHDRKGKVVREAKVYAGGVLKPEELRAFTLKQITARLHSPRAADGRWYVLRPGESLPFMVLFYNLPANLSEFTVEVAGSEPAPKSVLGPPAPSKPATSAPAQQPPAPHPAPAPSTTTAPHPPSGPASQPAPPSPPPAPAQVQPGR